MHTKTTKKRNKNAVTDAIPNKVELPTEAVQQIELLIERHEAQVARGMQGGAARLPKAPRLAVIRRSLYHTLNSRSMPHMLYYHQGRWYALWPVAANQATANFDVYPLAEIAPTT